MRPAATSGCAASETITWPPWAARHTAMATPVLTGRNAGGATVSVSAWIPMRTLTSAARNGGAANAPWRATATSTAACGPRRRMTPVSAVKLIIRPWWAAEVSVTWRSYWSRVAR